MATLQEALALKKQNPNLSTRDAIAKVEGNTTTQVTPIPVATATPPTTPIQNPPVTPPVSSSQTVTWVNGEKFQVAPVNAQWVTPQNTTQTPASPVTPPVVTQEPQKTSKIETPIDYNVWLGAEDRISKNLDTFKAQGMNADQIKSASGYNTADQNKKSQIEAYTQAMTAQANAPMSQKDVVNALISWVSVPKQNTRAYNNATVISDQFKKFNGMTDVQLLDNLKQWQIGTELDSLLSQNPNYAKAKAELAKIQKINSINRASQLANNAVSGKISPVVDDLKNIEAKYTAPVWANEQAYTDYITKNPDVVSAGSQVKQLSSQISSLTSTYNEALKKIKEENPNLSASAILTLMQVRTKDTKELLDSYINAKETAKWDFDLAMKMAEGHYTATAQDIAQANVLKNEQAKLQMTADFNKKQAEQALNDPATAISSVMDQFSKMWIVSQQSLQTKIADAQKFISQWGTLSGYIDKMRQDYMAKPEYRAYVEKTGGTDWQKLSDNTLFNPKTGETKSIGTTTNAPWTLPSSFTGDTASYIASKEGFRDKAYLDSAGIPTIGYGFTKIDWKPVKMWDTIDKATADAQFAKQIDAHSTWKSLIDPNTLSPSQQAALASFEYNLWPWIWNQSAMNIINMVKSGDLSGAGAEMQKYVNADGKVVKWLQNRRAEEAQLLMNTGAQKSWINQQELPQYISYYENNAKLPTGMKDNTPEASKFKEDAYNAYSAYKNQQLSNEWIKVNNLDNYINVDPKIKDKLDNSIDQASTILRNIQSMKNLVNTSGTELTPWTNAGSQMNSLFSDTVTKMKEIYNLWVLNWPDLSIISSAMSNPVWLSAFFTTNENAKKYLDNVTTRLISDINTKAKRYGIEFQWNTPTSTQSQWNTNTWAWQTVNSSSIEDKISAAKAYLNSRK